MGGGSVHRRNGCAGIDTWRMGDPGRRTRDPRQRRSERKPADSRGVGMPAYARDGKVVCFFQDAGKFKARYATLGFQDAANLDDGAMWPTSFALTKLTPAVKKQIVALVEKAVG